MKTETQNPRAAGEAAHTLPLLVTHRGINTQGIDHGLPYEFRGYSDVPPPNPAEPVFAAFGRTAEEAERRHMAIVAACNSRTSNLAEIQRMKAELGGYALREKLMEAALRESVEAMEMAGFDTMGAGNAATLDQARAALQSCKE